MVENYPKIELLLFSGVLGEACTSIPLLRLKISLSSSKPKSKLFAKHLGENGSISFGDVELKLSWNELESKLIKG